MNNNMKHCHLLAVLMLIILNVAEAQTQILVIPDIHGRIFWKDAVAKHPDIPVVFLGDYLDPYRHENISNESALENFEEILEFKRANPDRVTLLIGNHEIHYIDNGYYFSRKDTVNEEKIHNLIASNLNLFDMAAAYNIAGKDFLFTHSGVLEKWWGKHYNLDSQATAGNICNFLNEKMNCIDSLYKFIDKALMEIGKNRGGESEAGSCVWADVEEFGTQQEYFENIYQIFGHSQQRKRAIVKKNYADLDCRSGFVLDSKGRLKKL